MKGADLATRTLLFMLGRRAFDTYAALIKPTQKKKSVTRDPLEKTRREKGKSQAIYELIISTPAAGDDCKDPEATELGRIFSHIFWRRATQTNNDRPAHSDED